MKTADGIEINSRTGSVWAVNGLVWPHSIIELELQYFDEDDDLSQYYSSKAAAIDEAERRIAEREATFERRCATEREEIACRRQWIEFMRADVAKES